MGFDTKGAGGPLDPFSLAYRHLREAIVSAGLVPGQQVFVTGTAEALGLSATPVREALARLVGERFVQDRRGHGYFVPLLSWFELIDLVDLSENCLSAAARAIAGNRSRGLFPFAEAASAEGDGEAGAAGETAAETGTADRTGAIYRRLCASCPNAELALLGRICVDRLAAARRTGMQLSGGKARDESPALEAHLFASDWSALGRAIRRDHVWLRTHAEPIAYVQAGAMRNVARI